MGEMDIVERLREVKRGTSDVRVVAGRAKLITPYGNMMNEAADLIETLRADLAEQKAAHGDCIKRNIALTVENDALRAEKDNIRKATIEHAAHVAYAYAPRTFDSTAIAAAIRQMGEKPTSDDMPEGGKP